MPPEPSSSSGSASSSAAPLQNALASSGEKATSSTSTGATGSQKEKKNQKQGPEVLGGQSQPHVNKTASNTPEKATETNKAKVKKRLPDTEPETPAGKKKKIPPPGCGGAHKKALTCQICTRPRERDQRGSACPTCQKVMREKNCRSIPKVLADPEKCEEIRNESLKLRPLSSPDDKDVRDKISKIEKHLASLKSLL